MNFFIESLLYKIQALAVLEAVKASTKSNYFTK